MVIRAFPPIEEADPYSGLLAIGGDLEIESLLLAYRSGIFPWPHSEEYLTWFSPPTRAIFEVDSFHISRTTKRLYKSPRYQVAVNTRFEDVIRNCADSQYRQKEDAGTWITQDMIDAYVKLHDVGYAHSFECLFDGKLIGGVYGVGIDRMFAAESMYHSASNGSKLALTHLILTMKELQIPIVDVQVQSDFLESLGAIEVSRRQYVGQLQTLIDGSNTLMKALSEPRFHRKLMSTPDSTP